MWVRAALWILFLACAPLAAQRWEALRGMEGQRVKVIDTGGNVRKGICDSVSADGITVQNGGTSVTIERAKVRRVEARSGVRRARNIAIGAAIGLAIALTVDQTVGTYLRNETGDSYRGTTYVVPIGLFGGIGALSAYRTVYRVR